MRNATTGLLALGLCGPVLAQWGFQLQASASAPPPQIRSAMMFDAVRSETVLFDSQTAATWLWNGQVWRQASPTTSPPGRRFAQFTFDLVRGVGVLYGGRGNNSPTFQALDDTWLWDGTDWQQVAPLHSPGGFESHAAAFDLARSRLVFYGGRANAGIAIASTRTFEFDGTDWQEVITSTNPGAIELQAMCYDPVRGYTVMVGGIDPAGGVGTLAQGTWIYDGTDWTQLNLTPAPAPRVDGRMVFDLARGVGVLVGGYDPITGVFFNDTWEWNGTWQQVAGPAGSVSPPRHETMVAMDQTRGRIVMFGGRTPNNAILDETWEYGAQFRAFGSGCPGSAGIPQLRESARPVFGTVGANTVSNLLPSATLAVFVTGLSNQTSTLGTLPRLLTPFGLPGCRIYVSPDLFQVVPASNGSAAWTWSVPRNLSLFGAAFYQQAVSLDPGINAAGLTVSNAGAAQIGW